MAQEENKNDLIMQQVAMMEAIDKVEYDGYQLMARIAIALFFANEWITFSELKIMMNDRGYEYSEGGNRGLASSVKTAEESYRNINEDLRHAIAVSFRSKDGNLAFNPDN